MSDLVSLNEARALKANDNALWSPLECVEAFARDVRAGTVKPTRVLVLYEEPEADGGLAFSTYAANVQRDAEIAMLWMRLHSVTHKWERRS